MRIDNNTNRPIGLVYSIPLAIYPKRTKLICALTAQNMLAKKEIIATSLFVSIIFIPLWCRK